MSPLGAVAGKTRVCPHCKTQILESASVCPACRHHLRYDPAVAGGQPAHSFSALKVEGDLANPPGGEPWEYTVLVTVRNERGEEITRHVVGVGALRPTEQRTFSLSVEVATARGRR
ncbi:MAG TPA: hypothetical protein VLT59_07555 [Steroidobacteraceae bacterium]|nr:hypothetical protein [Steroidobacteraceae bacterium]